jgi:hypothetical protein
MASEVVSRELDGGLLLLNLQTGFTWTLNRMGANVYRRLDGTTDTVAIVSDLQKVYRVDAGQLAADVDALLDDLQHHGLVEPVAADASR